MIVASPDAAKEGNPEKSTSATATARSAAHCARSLISGRGRSSAAPRKPSGTLHYRSYLRAALGLPTRPRFASNRGVAVFVTVHHS